MSSAMLGPESPCTRALRLLLRRLASAEEGSFLVEALVSAVILVIAAVGVLEALDRGSRLGGEQKIQAVAGNVAQSEQELIRALPVSAQSNMHRVSSRTVGEITYAVDSRANWVNDSSGEASCTTAGSAADYMKLSTVVSWPRMAGRKAVTLKSLISPGVRAFDARQGSLAVKISKADGAPLSGLQLNLSGGATLSDATSAAGCVLWGYLPADAPGGYRMSFSRPPDYVLPDGSQTADVPVPVVAQTTSNVALQFDQGGHITTRFVSKRSAGGALVATNPQKAHVTNSGGGGISAGFDVTSGGGTSGLLFPFTSAYTVHADSCAAAEVPGTAPDPVPGPADGFPAAPAAVAVSVEPGRTATSAAVQLPALNIIVKSGGVLKVDARIRVTTPCGTVYDRRTLDSPYKGQIEDTGFPYATSLSICAYDGTRHRTVTKPNNNFNVSPVPIDVLSTDPSGPCP